MSEIHVETRGDYALYVEQGDRGRWRWLIRSVSMDEVRAVCPVVGYDTQARAALMGKVFLPRRPSIWRRWWG